MIPVQVDVHRLDVIAVRMIDLYSDIHMISTLDLLTVAAVVVLVAARSTCFQINVFSIITENSLVVLPILMTRKKKHIYI